MANTSRRLETDLLNHNLHRLCIRMIHVGMSIESTRIADDKLVEAATVVEPVSGKTRDLSGGAKPQIDMLE